MNNARAYFALTFSVALAGACGGSSTSIDAGEDGSLADAPGTSSSGGGSRSDSSSGSSSGGAPDGGGMACTIGGCPAGQVCCQRGCQAQTACGMTGNRQLCGSNADCPAAYPACRATGGMGAPMTCRACQATNDCSSGLVCCQMGCQMQAACGMTGNRQLCTSNSECPANYPDCRGNPATCRTPMPEGGAPDGGGVSDGSTTDGSTTDSATTDGGESDAPSDGSASDAPSSG